jgi:hypothetical protein
MEMRCFLCGTDSILKYYLDKRRLQRVNKSYFRPSLLPSKHSGKENMVVHIKIHLQKDKFVANNQNKTKYQHQLVTVPSMTILP